MLHQSKKHIKTKRNAAPAATIVADIIIEKFHDTKDNIVVAIGGPGGSGKSTFAAKLQKRLQQTCSTATMRLDNYRISRTERANSNLLGSHPQANKIELIANHLKLMKKGDQFKYPLYSNVAGTTDKTATYIPTRINLIEGELSTNDNFKQLVDFTIFIDSDWKTQLNTRLSRDVDEHNHSMEKAINTFLVSNLNDFQMFGAEGKNIADIHLFCDDNYYVSIEAVSEDLYDSYKHLLKGYNEISLDGDVYIPSVNINSQGKADIAEFAAQLDKMHAEGIERIIINECPLASFYLSEKEKMELLSLSEEYFPGVIIYQLSNAPKESVMKEIKTLQNHSIDAFTIDLKFFEYHLGIKHLRPFIFEIIDNSDIPLFFFEEDLADFYTYFVKSDKMKIAPIAKRKKKKTH